MVHTTGLVTRVWCLFAAVAAATSATGCSRGLRDPISCRNVLQLDIGQSEETVRGILGTSKGVAVATGGVLLDDTRYERSLQYGLPSPESWYTTYDSFGVEFAQGRLVEALAIRRRYNEPENAELVFRLRARPQGGTADREIGPAFERVFVCDAQFSRQSMAADIREVRFTFKPLTRATQ